MNLGPIRHKLRQTLQLLQTTGLPRADALRVWEQTNREIKAELEGRSANRLTKPTIVNNVESVSPPY